jgi:hypothetical protein
MDKVVIVSPQEIHARFNSSEFASLDGLTAKILRDAEIKNPKIWQGPQGTRSQTIRYFKGNQWVVEVHQYLRPDGTLGASGRPDPKRLRMNGFIYTVPPTSRV